MKKKPLVLIIIFSTIFVICLGCIISFEYNNYVERQKLEALQKELENLDSVENSPKPSAEIKTQPEETPEPEPTPETLEEPLVVLPAYEKLLNENNDLFGWIKIDDTSIDFPIMQTIEDQNFYLRKDWNKDYSWYGLPFADCQVTLDSNNVIIYGHNMSDGAMFGDLTKYKDVSFYESHKFIKFDTLYEKGLYEIISVSKTTACFTYEEVNKLDYYFYFHINMNSEEEFNEYVSKAKETAYFDTDVTAEYGDKLLTLSTCDYWTENARLLVIAKKVS